MSDLIPSTLVTTLCAHRADVLARMEHAIRKMREGFDLAEQADLASVNVHGGAVFFDNDRSRHEGYRRIFSDVDVDRSLKLYQHQLDARGWTYLLNVSGIADAMDRTAKEEFRATLCSDDVPELTEDNIRATFEHLAGSAQLIFARGVARAFVQLDPRFRSHDAFRFEDRVILKRVFDEYGHFVYSMVDTFLDMERVFAVLDKQQPEGRAIIDAIRAQRAPRWDPQRSELDTRYFKVRAFKNGNMHLWFTRKDLVERVNLVLADYYGAVLPDATPFDYGINEPRTTALSKDLAFYPTPDPVIDRMLAHTSLDKAIVLEPSAGTGNIVRRALTDGASTVTAVEVDAGRAATIRAKSPTLRVEVVQENFLRMGAVAKYTHVLMNPPFSGTHWMDHVRHAFDFLQPGGVLIAVLPVTAETGTTAKHAAFQAWAELHKDNWKCFSDLPPESFASSGTRISTVILRLKKR